MARGSRGGADQADTSKPLIATSDELVGGDYDGQKMAVSLLATGPDTAPIVVEAGAGLPVAGETAHDASATGKRPVLVAGKASDGSQTAVAFGDVVDAWLTRLGALVVAGRGAAGADSLADYFAQVKGLDDSNLTLGMFQFVFNSGSGGWDRMRGDAANGVDVDVTRLPSLPAGSAAIGKLAANSGVDIGDVDVTSLPAIAGAVTDGSGTITTGGTAQTALAANATRKWLFVQNLDPVEDLWINIGVTAVLLQPSIRLAAYQAFENPAQFCPSALISVKAATTGHKFVAKEG